MGDRLPGHWQATHLTAPLMARILAKAGRRTEDKWGIRPINGE